MKLWTWKYVDTSNPDVPNRMIKWDFGIPYLLKISRSRWGFHGGGSVDIWFLCFGFNLTRGCHCGKVTKFHWWHWYLSLVIRRGWSSEFRLGIDRGNVTDWRVKRMLKKMTPQEFDEHCKMMQEMIDSYKGE